MVGIINKLVSKMAAPTKRRAVDLKEESKSKKDEGDSESSSDESGSGAGEAVLGQEVSWLSNVVLLLEALRKESTWVRFK